MSTHTTLRDTIAAQLLSDAIAHDEERYDSIGRRFDSIEHSFPRGTDPAMSSLRIALTFWDAWIDARNYGWRTTVGIQQQDWPVLARALVEDLTSDRDITDERIRRRFDAASNPASEERVLVLAARLRGP